MAPVWWVHSENIDTPAEMTGDSIRPWSTTMSYEIVCSFNSDKPSRSKFDRYVGRRERYESTGDGALYADTDTGVRFEVLVCDSEAGVETVAFQCPAGVPEVYGQEIAEELEALRGALGGNLAAEGDDVDVDEARHHWEEANRAAVAEQIDDGKTLNQMPADKVRGAWYWNRGRQAYHGRRPGSLFVPRVHFFAYDGDVGRGIIWPDAIPVALPPVDLLLVSLPEEMLDDEGAADKYVIGYEEFLEGAEAAAEQTDDPEPHLVLSWEEVPTDVIEHVVEVGEVASPDGLEGLSAEHIFEQELVEEIERG
jgi:hypothetical protein